MNIKTIKKNQRYTGFLIAMVLLISLCKTAQAQSENWVYTVRNGDNLWNLTVDYLIDISYVDRVRKLNNIADPWHILPGTKIIIPRQWIRQYPALVRVLNLQGTAQVLEEGADQPRQLKVGSIMMLGDTVLTDADSSLVIGFINGSRILLQENSRLKINKLMLLENTGMSDTRLELETGRMETQVVPSKGSARKFLITTPATVTSVRGTDYRISAERKSNESRTEVVEGKVVVSGDRKSLLLRAGFGTVTKKGMEPLKPVKLLPKPDLDALPRVFSQVPIQFVMVRQEQARGYRVQIAKTELFRDILFDKPYSSGIFRGPELADGDYHIRIRAFDENRVEGLNADRKMTVNARPASPFLISPKPGEGRLQESPEFVWANQQGIEKYHLQIASDKGFSHLVIDKSDIDTNQWDISAKLPVGKYYWRVAAVDQDGDGPFSDGQMFRRIVPAPELEAPEISEQTVVIRSREGLPGQTYHFQMAADDTFAELLVDQYTDKPGFEIQRPDGGEYFVRVRTIDPDGFIGPFAEPQSFRVPYNYYWLLTLLPLLALLAL